MRLLEFNARRKHLFTYDPGVLQAEADRLSMIGDGAIKIALGGIRLASCFKVPPIWPLKPDGMITIGYRAIEIAIGGFAPSPTTPFKINYISDITVYTCIILSPVTGVEVSS